MRKFAQAACIDWSGAVAERPPGLAVAMIEHGRAPELVYPDRRWSRSEILQWLVKLANEEADILIGLDLSFGFPFLDQNSYFPQWQDSPPTARKLWQLVDEICHDDPHYGASNFVKSYSRQSGISVTAAATSAICSPEASAACAQLSITKEKRNRATAGAVSIWSVQDRLAKVR